MPPVRFPDGQIVNFPDGTPKEVIDQHYQQNYGATAVTPTSNSATMATNYLRNRQPVESTMPTLAGTNFAFGNQAGVNAVMQAEQRSNENSLQAKMQREQQTQREIEGEKSRAASVKLEQLRHKNELASYQLKLDRDQKLIEAKEEVGKAVRRADGVLGRQYTVTDPQTGDKSLKTVWDESSKVTKPPSLITSYDEQGNAVRVEDKSGVSLGKKPSTASPSQGLERNVPIRNEDGSVTYMDGFFENADDPELGGTTRKFIPLGPSRTQGGGGEKSLTERVSKAVRDLKSAGMLDKDSDFQTNMKALIDTGQFTEEDLLPLYKKEVEQPGYLSNFLRTVFMGNISSSGDGSTSSQPAPTQGQRGTYRGQAGTLMPDGTFLPD